MLHKNYRNNREGLEAAASLCCSGGIGIISCVLPGETSGSSSAERRNTGYAIDLLLKKNHTPGGKDLDCCLDGG